MKMRIATRTRQFQGDKNLIVYRRSESGQSATIVNNSRFSQPRLQNASCAPQSSDILPIRFPTERSLSDKISQFQRRYPEPTVIESVEVLTLQRLDD
jgi:hypothetical protein